MVIIPDGVLHVGCVMLMAGAEGNGFMVISTLVEVGHPSPVTLVALYRIVPVDVGVAVTLFPVVALNPAFGELADQLNVLLPPDALSVTVLP